MVTSVGASAPLVLILSVLLARFYLICLIWFIDLGVIILIEFVGTALISTNSFGEAILPVIELTSGSFFSYAGFFSSDSGSTAVSFTSDCSTLEAFSTPCFSASWFVGDGASFLMVVAASSLLGVDSSFFGVSSFF